MYSEVVEIDDKNEFPLKDKEQIKVFLLYQHAKGNLIYFDEEPLSAYVALDTQYVIDAFKCIITSETFCKKEPAYRHLWKTLRQEAKLNMQLLETIWGTDAKNNFLEHKDVLLMVLQRHYIISEALSYDDKTEETKGLGWYVVPCFLRSYRANDALKEFVTGRQQTLLKFVMSFNISPVVQIVFYRVVAALIGKWEIASIKIPEQEKQVLLYENLGVFKLDRQHVGIIELYQGFIELRVQNLCNSGVNVAIVDLFRRFVVSNVKNEFRKHRHAAIKQRNPFEICFKCNDQSHGFDGSRQTVSMEELKETTVEPCPDGLSGHTICTRQALYEWYQDYQNIRLKTDYVLEEKYISKLSKTVAENWQVLGHELGLHDVQLEHIEMDNKSTVRMIFKMLQKWSAQKEDNATFNTLIQAMKSSIEKYVDWDEVRNIVEEIESKI
ncbi:uncharacterized protein LOC132751534 [Ruditapes philippinarum]|uniref:uncharacterized protein LOC132751534 n=1 Tax=Ruditapes philippinarum TaxID=129788 RepID=UPI00295AFB35|nr:uncharacterized protein LOC132751534 [Ruditapes philippinarum]